MPAALSGGEEADTDESGRRGAERRWLGIAAARGIPPLTPAGTGNRSRQSVTRFMSRDVIVCSTYIAKLGFRK